MSKNHGNFVWYAVMTSDTEAAASFYCSVIGWGTEDSGALPTTLPVKASSCTTMC